MKLRQIISLSIALLLIIGVASLSFAGVVVIVNPQNSVSSLSSKDMRNIYRLKKTTWAAGDKIKVVNLGKKDTIREKFSELILKKSPAVMEKFYLKRALAGKGQPPKVLNSSSDVKEFVRINKNAIGYIDVKDADNSVRVLSIDGKKEID